MAKRSSLILLMILGIQHVSRLNAQGIVGKWLAVDPGGALGLEFTAQGTMVHYDPDGGTYSADYRLQGSRVFADAGMIKITFDFALTRDTLLLRELGRSPQRFIRVPFDPEPRRLLSLVKEDVRTIMAAQNEYFSARKAYASDVKALQSAKKIQFSPFNTVEVVGTPEAYEAAVANPVIRGGPFNMCFVREGGGIPVNESGQIICNQPAPYRFQLTRQPAALRGAPERVDATPSPEPSKATGRVTATSIGAVVPGGRIGVFQHGTRVHACYVGGKLVDIQERATPFNQRCDRVRDLVHAGIDISARLGSPIYPVANGKVIDVVSATTDSNWSSLGYAIFIEHGQTNGQIRTYDAYFHLAAPPAVGKGDSVTVGQTVLGVVGATGAAFGSHLHLEVRHFAVRFSPGWSNIYGIEAPPSSGGTFDARDFEKNWEDPSKLLTGSAGTSSAPASSALLRRGLGLFQAKQWNQAITVLDTALALPEPPDQAFYFAAISRLQLVSSVDGEVDRTKSCSGVRQQQTLLTEAARLLGLVKTTAPDQVPLYRTSITGYQRRYENLQRAFCR